MSRISKFIFLSFILSLLTIFTSISIFASKKITNEVSILNPKQNIHGTGYEWNNRTDTLVLKNLNIDTTDDYGLKITDGATVILKGDNYIKASKAALYIGGNVIIKGKGTLTVEGGETGILFNSTKNTDKLSITSGKFEITGGIDGIRADYSKVMLSGASLKISGGNGYAINVRDLLTSSGVTLKVEGSLYTSSSMLIQATNLSAKSDKPVLISDGTMKIENVDIKVGENLNNLKESDSYSNQKAIVTSSKLDNSIKSIIFGAPYSIAIDIILLILAVAALVLAIVIPKIIRKKKAAAVIKNIKSN